MKLWHTTCLWLCEYTNKPVQNRLFYVCIFAFDFFSSTNFQLVRYIVKANSHFPFNVRIQWLHCTQNNLLAWPSLTQFWIDELKDELKVCLSLYKLYFLWYFCLRMSWSNITDIDIISLLIMIINISLRPVSIVINCASRVFLNSNYVANFDSILLYQIFTEITVIIDYSCW